MKFYIVRNFESQKFWENLNVVRQYQIQRFDDENQSMKIQLGNK